MLLINLLYMKICNIIEVRLIKLRPIHPFLHFIKWKKKHTHRVTMQGLISVFQLIKIKILDMLNESSEIVP